MCTIYSHTNTPCTQHISCHLRVCWGLSKGEEMAWIRFKHINFSSTQSCWKLSTPVWVDHAGNCCTCIYRDDLRYGDSSDESPAIVIIVYLYQTWIWVLQNLLTFSIRWQHYHSQQKCLCMCTWEGGILSQWRLTSQNPWYTFHLVRMQCECWLGSHSHLNVFLQQTTQVLG